MLASQSVNLEKVTFAVNLSTGLSAPCSMSVCRNTNPRPSNGGVKNNP